MPVKCYLSLGSNIGDRNKNLTDAKMKIQESLGTIIAESSIYETEPWGFNALQNFYNQVIAIHTPLDPFKLLEKCLSIETELGRNRTSANYESRAIDIDILFYGQEIIRETNLTVPHPNLHMRKFVLMPLSDLEPNLLHPVQQKRIWELLEGTTDNCWIKKIPLSK